MEDTSIAKQCQTCYATFDNIDTLREHIWRYQAEVNWHSSRIQEAQLHLPPRQHRVPWNQTHRRLCDTCARWPQFESYYEAGGDADDAPNCEQHVRRPDNTDNDPGESVGGERPFKCPEKSCNRTFMRMARLFPHFCEHVQCFEICVYCRVPFSNISDFFEHKCSKPENHIAKEFYMMERQSQLQQYAKKQLSLMDPSLPKPQERKRPQELAEMCSVIKLGKRRKTSTVADPGENFGFAAHRHDENSSALEDLRTMLPTPSASISNNTTDSEVDFATSLGTSLSHGVPELLPHLPSRMIAPMFRDVTITPRYGTEQYGGHFHSSLADTVADHDQSVFNSFDATEISDLPFVQIEPSLHNEILGGGTGFVGGPVARMVAPMFQNVTITPRYETGQAVQFEQTRPDSIISKPTDILDTLPFESVVGQLESAGTRQTT